MSRFAGLERRQRPDWEALLANLRRRGTPKRVHHMELFHDGEVVEAMARRFGLDPEPARDDPDFGKKRLVAVHRFLGFDYVPVVMQGLGFSMNWHPTEDTAALGHEAGRHFVDECRGPITSWEEFERYPWPDPRAADATRDLEWFEKNLPEDMGMVALGIGHCCELLLWLMGYETLAYLLHDARDLVRALADRVLSFFEVCLERIFEFDRVGVIFASDDMGFKTGPLISPADLREFVLPGHRRLARMAHEAGRLYLLHSCGNIRTIMADLIEDVRIDGKHSFEDTIEDVREAKRTYGRHVALVGGMDVDFLCRADEAAIRKRVRETLDECLPGGGYCLGTGNSVANYIPVDHYLAMVDEGRLYGA